MNSHNMDYCKCCDTVMLRYCDFLLTLLISPLNVHLNCLCCCMWYHFNPWPSFLCYHVRFRRYNTKYIGLIWLWRNVKWLPWPPQGVFAMAPFLTMFRAANYTSVPSFMFLWKSEQYFHISRSIFSFIISTVLTKGELRREGNRKNQ